VNVSDHMTTTPVCANLRDGLHQTYYRMRERGIRHMPVLDEHGGLAGIITERDLLRPGYVDDGPTVSGSFVLDNAQHVASAMTPDPITVRPETPITEALPLFVERRYGAVPVVDGEGRLVGILSAIDLLRAFSESLART
jgi:acetoin utilization protein AcuB